MNKKKRDTKKIVLCALFTALISVGAYIKIPLPTVPLTLQLFFVLLAGLTLGAKWGAVSSALYAFIGLAGLPVFTGGTGGIFYVFKPTFGYILGFILAAYITGLIYEKFPKKKKSPAGLLAALAGVLVSYIFGGAYYWIIFTFYMGKTLSITEFIVTFFLLPLPGDLIKCVAAALAAKRCAAFFTSGH